MDSQFGNTKAANKPGQDQALTSTTAQAPMQKISSFSLPRGWF
jgi:hypothetical protein